MVTLSRLGNDTLVTIPIKTLRLINIQLKKASIIKADFKVLSKQTIYFKHELTLKKSIILKQNKELAIKDSLLNSQAIKIKQQGWEWLRIENRYIREKKKANKFKRFFIGSLILSVGTITIISLK